MKWRSLILERAPGVTSGLRLDECSPGLNIVLGPNGVGKSTLSRAARALVWEGELFKGGHVVGELDLGGEVFGVEREGAAPIRWGTQPSTLPRFPDDRFRGCFHLSLDELVDRGGMDASIAGEVRKEMAGGYELHQVGLETLKPRAGKAHSARRALEKAAQLARDEDAAARSVLEREKRIPELEAKKQAALGKAGEERALTELLELLDADQELADLRAAAEGTDPLLSGFESSSQLEHLGELDHDLGTAAQELSNKEAQLRAEGAALAALGLPEGGAASEALVDGRALAEALRRGAGRLEELGGELARRRGELEGAPLPHDGEGWTEDALEGARELLSHREHLALKHSALQSARASLPGGATEGTQGEARGESPERAIRALMDWLTASPEGAGGSSSGRQWSFMAAALLGLGVAALLAGREVPSLAWLAPLILILIGARRGGGGAAASLELQRAKAQRRFEETDAVSPRRWDEEGVGLVLEDQVARWAGYQSGEKLGQVREELDRELTRLDGELEMLGPRLDALRGRLGVGAERSLEAKLLLEAAGRDRDLRGVAAQWATVEADVKRTAAALEEQRSRALGLSDEPAPVLDAPVALERWVDLDSRQSKFAALAKARDQAREDCRAAQERLTDREHALDKLVASVGLDANMVSAVLGREKELGAVLERRQKMSALERRSVEARAQLGESWPDLCSLGREEIQGALREVGDHVAKAEEQRAKIADIRAEVSQLQRNVRFVELEHAESEATAKLKEAREAALEAVSMELLLGEVSSRHRKEGRPAVLQRADDYFQRFTRDEYALEDPDGEELQAVRVGSPIRLTPDQLSSGTRAQLLMALRLAYADHAERGEKLPFFFDEAMLTSDPERYAAIATVLGEMVSAGRQVFYLTAEPREEVELRRALPEGTPIKLHDVGGRAAELRAVAGDSLELAELPAVAPPAGDSFDTYAPKVGVWRVDGFEGADALHLLHLYSAQLDVAYLALERRYQTVGSVRQLLARTPEALWNEAERARFRALFAVANRTLAIWREGRVRPLDGELLRGTTIARSSKLGAVLEVAERVQWDAARLLDELENKAVKGFKSSLREELREELEARGLLAQSEPLDAPSLRAKVRGELFELDPGRILGPDEAEQLVLNLQRWLGAP